jgi:hypothetical protein
MSRGSWTRYERPAQQLEQALTVETASRSLSLPRATTYRGKEAEDFLDGLDRFGHDPGASPTAGLYASAQLRSSGKDESRFLLMLEE